MHFLAKRQDCFEAPYVCALAFCVASNVAQGQDAKKDIPSVAREALKCLVTIETKDGLGKASSQASGFLVSNDGKVVTNYHAIQGAASGPVLFGNAWVARALAKEFINRSGPLATSRGATHIPP